MALAVDIKASPWTFTSSSNVVYLKTLNAELSNFRIKWHVLESSLGLDMDCVWVITASEGRQIRLLLHEVHFEAPQMDCSNAESSLSVSAPSGSNSSVVLYRSCHEETQTQTFTSPGNELVVHFVSSPSPTRKYFKASYVQVPASCGGLITASSGVLTSPGFHNLQDSSNVANYSTNVECVWTVEVGYTDNDMTRLFLH